MSGKEDIYTYVYLGLSSGTKWATYNAVASLPTEYGGYFAWGETKPKEDYSWSTYKWCKDGNKKILTKYNTDSKYANVDNKMVWRPMMMLRLRIGAVRGAFRQQKN